MFALCREPYAFGLFKYHPKSIIKIDIKFMILAYEDVSLPTISSRITVALAFAH